MKKRKSKKKKDEDEILDIPSSTKKLKDMKALIDSNLSPIKAEPNDADDFRLTV